MKMALVQSCYLRLIAKELALPCRAWILSVNVANGRACNYVFSEVGLFASSVYKIRLSARRALATQASAHFSEITTIAAYAFGVGRPHILVPITQHFDAESASRRDGFHKADIDGVT